MNIKNLIPANDFCFHHNIAISFIGLLHETGLIRIITIDDSTYIHKNQLPELEKFVRFYGDLGINLEGIETISHLLNRIKKMQVEMSELKNRLLIYDSFYIDNV